MKCSIQRIVVSIAGGHATGVIETGEEIRRSLRNLFPSTNIRIINLDELDPNVPRRYSHEDYDFDHVYNEIFEAAAIPPISSKISGVKDPIEIVLLCGSYALYDNRINQKAQLKIFLDSDGDKRLINLIRKRHISSKEQLTELLTEYLDHLRLEMQKYINPTRAQADLIIPSKFDATARAIIVDGIFKVVEALRGEKSPQSISKLSALLLDFEAEAMDMEKERYYDLS